MATVTFQILEGVDRGRIFRDMPTPITIGREEGNLLRLNDERVSRFHVKIQQDNDDIILTDLESTNGTRVNGKVVQIRRLRPGDRICVGRSLILFGSNEEIAARMASNLTLEASGDESKNSPQLPATIQAQAIDSEMEQDYEFDLNLKDDITRTAGNLFSNNRQLPPMPLKLTPGQAARCAEVLDFLHRGLTQATENLEANEEGTQVTLSFADWQKVLAVQMLLALYLRAVTDPDSLQQ